MRSKVLWVGLLLGLVAFALGVWAQQPRVQVKVQTEVKVGFVEENPVTGGKLDWTKGIVWATGYGVPPENVRGPRARLLARLIAIKDAQRNLAETLKGVHITATTTIVNFGEQVDDRILTRLDTFLRGYRFGPQVQKPDGTWEVTLWVPMYGQAGVAGQVIAPFLPRINEREPEKVPVVRPETPPPPPTPVPERKPGPYTGVVIDARGFGVRGSMSPKIRRADGSEVWGTVQVSREFVQETGIVGYHVDLDTALRPEMRAGENPLVLRAIGVAGAGKTDVVISDEDAALLLAENEKARFLEKFRVIFVVDRPEGVPPTAPIPRPRPVR